MMFIDLDTYVSPDFLGDRIKVKADSIDIIEYHNDYTMVVLSSGEYRFVIQTPEEILDSIAACIKRQKHYG